MVGPNGAGKSTVLAALNVFFRSAATSQTSVTELQEEDFHARNTSTPIKITLTFEDLSPEAVADLAHYVRQDRLIVAARATWEPARRIAPVVQLGIRLAIPRLSPFFRADGDKRPVAELVEVYDAIRKELSELPEAKTKSKMTAALREYEARHAEELEPIESNDEFYGATKGQGKLDKYIQWVHVPAVRDASKEDIESKTTWLGQLLDRAVRKRVSFQSSLDVIRREAQDKYGLMLAAEHSVLSELSAALTTRMRDWASPDAALLLKWEGDPAKSIQVQAPFARVEAKDGEFLGALVRQGHGFQRSYLLALLQELAGGDDDGGPTLLLGCEEPELYQHPPQARHLAGVFVRLSEAGSQVLVCTHSPLFVGGRTFEDVRLVNRSAGSKESGVRSATLAELKALLEGAKHHPPRNVAGARLKLETTLNPWVSEMFFSPVLILVEGLEDAAYLSAELDMSGKMSEFRRLGCHIVPAGGKDRLPQLQSIAQLMGIPTFTVFDGDDSICGGAEPSDPSKQDRWRADRARHERDNAAIFHLALGAAHGLPAMPPSHVWSAKCVGWLDNIGTAVRNDVGIQHFQSAQERVRVDEGIEDPNLAKNPMFIGLTVERLYSDGHPPMILRRLAAVILEFAASIRTVPHALVADSASD
jgi:energy-coupling factor transporter ATP-binding protein EcfA2